MLGPEEWTALALSLRVAAVATLLLAVPGIALGWLLARRRFPGRAALEAAIHLPLVLPPVVTGYLLLLALGRASPLGRLLAELGLAVPFTWLGAVAAAAVVALPLLVRSVRLAIELGDRRLEEASLTLGAGPLRTFGAVTLPLAAPGVVAGLVLAFARAFGEFGATITLAGSIPGATRTLPLAIHAALQTPGGDAVAWRLTVVAVAVAVVAMAVAELAARRMARRLERAP